MVAVKGSPRAYPAGAVPGARPYGGRGHPPKPAYPGPAASLRQLAIAAAGQIQPVTWRQGTKAGRGNPEAVMTSHFLAIRARPAGTSPARPTAASRHAGCWAEWPPEADEPTDYWLSNLPGTTPVAELVRLAKIRWRIEVLHELQIVLALILGACPLCCQPLPKRTARQLCEDFRELFALVILAKAFA